MNSTMHSAYLNFSYDNPNNVPYLWLEYTLEN